MDPSVCTSHVPPAAGQALPMYRCAILQLCCDQFVQQVTVHPLPYPTPHHLRVVAFDLVLPNSKEPQVFKVPAVYTLQGYGMLAWLPAKAERVLRAAGGHVRVHGTKAWVAMVEDPTREADDMLFVFIRLAQNFEKIAELYEAAAAYSSSSSNSTDRSANAGSNTPTPGPRWVVRYS